MWKNKLHFQQDDFLKDFMLSSSLDEYYRQYVIYNPMYEYELHILSAPSVRLQPSHTYIEVIRNVFELNEIIRYAILRFLLIWWCSCKRWKC